MRKIKKIISNNNYARFCIYFLLTFTLLAIITLCIMNFSSVTSKVANFFNQLLDSLAPLIIGIILAYLLEPIVSFFCKKINISRLISSIITYILIFLILATIIYGFFLMILGYFPKESPSALFVKLIEYVSSYKNTIAELIHEMPDLFSSGTSDYISGVIINWFSENLNTSIFWESLHETTSALINILIGIIISIYLLIDKDMFIRGVKSLCHLTLKQKTHGILAELGHETHKIFSTYIRGTLLDTLIVTILSAITLALIDIPFAPFLGILIGLLNIIPYFGAFLGIFVVFISALVSDSITSALLASLLIFILQQIEGNLIYPKIVGQSTGLHPLTVLVAISFFGYFYGVLGMILAVPIAGILQTIIKYPFEK